MRSAGCDAMSTPTDRSSSQPPPTFEAPAPPPAPPSTTSSTTHPPSHAHHHHHHNHHAHQAPSSFARAPAQQAGTLAPGGSLPPLEVEAAPLGEAESDGPEGEEEEEEGGEAEEEEECSACSCSCSEAESSVYAETEFADDVRASLQEPEVRGGGRQRERER